MKKLILIAGMTLMSLSAFAMENPRQDQCDREPELWFCDHYYQNTEDMNKSELKGFIERLLKTIEENSEVDSDFPGDRTAGR